MSALNQRAAEADMRLKRLYNTIEAGSLDPVESALGERIAGREPPVRTALSMYGLSFDFCVARHCADANEL